MSRSLLRAAAAVGAALAVAAAGLALLIALAAPVEGRGTAWRGLAGAGGVSAAAAALSLGPLAWGLGRARSVDTVHPAVAGYFLATAVRAVAGLGGCVWLIGSRGFPPVATLLSWLVLHAAALAAEAAVVSRRLWRLPVAAGRFHFEPDEPDEETDGADPPAAQLVAPPPPPA